MKIAVNTRLLLENKLEGIGWFSFETLKRITITHPEHEFIFIFDRTYSDKFIFSGNIKPIVLGPPSRHPVLWYWWFEHRIPLVLSQEKPDLFLSPDGYLSLKSDIPSLPVIHDINFEHYPHDLPYFYRQYYKGFFPKYAQKATRIATVSEFSKSDIVERYAISPDKIDVVYNGINSNYLPVSQSEQENTRKKYTQNCPYFLFVGALHPRKNIGNLLKAFELFKPSDDQRLKLLLVGEKKWWTKEMETTLESMKFKSDVIFTGRLDANELKKVIPSALAMVYVSYFEGFGIPIVEAFQSHTPVITSNCTSMPEIAGDAALIVNPFSPESISEALIALSKNSELQQLLINKGINRALAFSWDKTAEKLWDSIEKTLHHA